MQLQVWAENTVAFLCGMQETLFLCGLVFESAYNAKIRAKFVVGGLQVSHQ